MQLGPQQLSSVDQARKVLEQKHTQWALVEEWLALVNGYAASFLPREIGEPKRHSSGQSTAHVSEAHG